MYLVHWPSAEWEPSVWEVEVIGKVHGTVLTPLVETLEHVPYSVIFEKLIWTATGKRHLPPPVNVAFIHHSQFYDKLGDALDRIKELKKQHIAKALEEQMIAEGAFDKAAKKVFDCERYIATIQDIELPLLV